MQIAAWYAWCVISVALIFWVARTLWLSVRKYLGESADFAGRLLVIGFCCVSFGFLSTDLTPPLSGIQFTNDPFGFVRDQVTRTLLAIGIADLMSLWVLARLRRSDLSCSTRRSRGDRVLD